MKFKIGDKVQYKIDHRGFAENNGHDPYATYTVSELSDPRYPSYEHVLFEESDKLCFTERLELVKEKAKSEVKMLDKSDVQFKETQIKWALIGKNTGRIFGHLFNTRKEARSFKTDVVKIIKVKVTIESA